MKDAMKEQAKAYLFFFSFSFLITSVSNPLSAMDYWILQLPSRFLCLLLDQQSLNWLPEAEWIMVFISDFLVTDKISSVNFRIKTGNLFEIGAVNDWIQSWPLKILHFFAFFFLFIATILIQGKQIGTWTCDILYKIMLKKWLFGLKSIMFCGVGWIKVEPIELNRYKNGVDFGTGE